MKKFLILFLFLISQLNAQSLLWQIMMEDDFHPTEVSGLVKWYAQSYGKVTNSDSANVWVDKMGLDSATQTDNPSCPRIIYNELNGHSVLRFDGSNDRLTFTTFDYREYSVFVVFKATTLGSNHVLISRSYNNDFFQVLVMSSADGTNPNKIRFRVNAVSTYSTQAITGAWKIGSFLCSTSGNYQGMFINGILQGESATGEFPSYNPNDKPSIGAMMNTAGNYAYSYKGDIAEILIYNSRVSVVDRGKIETYLSNKYKITP